MFLKFFYLVLSLSPIFAFSQEQYVDMGALSFKNNSGESILAITLNNSKDWHTYWKNPGDAGLEVKMKFSSNGQDIELEDLPWPAPKRYIEQGNMWAYGYSDKYAMFFKLPNELKSKSLKITGEWLVCKDICIPGTRTVEVNLDNNLEFKNVGAFLDTKKTIDIYNKLPKNGNLEKIQIFLTKSSIKENQLALHYIIENADFSKINKKVNIITPYLRPLFDYKHEEIYLDTQSNTIYGRMYLDWDGLYESPEIPLPQDGIFKSPLMAKYLIQYPNDTEAKIVTTEFKQFTLSGDAELTENFKKYQKLGEKTKVTPSTKKNEASFFYYILLAFLGGLILNLMPCVLPVISLKLFGLIVHSNESKKQILKHNIFYTLGVLFSFLVLATVIVLMKLSGDQVGWGFQLQSPNFVLVMIIILFIMALNMLGLFEFVTPGGKKLGNAALKKGVGADFINGILATILSTPCSAPFLGTALTFAFTTNIINIYFIFISVAIGLSFPFLMTGFFPAFIRFLPKPGMWMDHLKKFLGVSLILTIIWLYDVYFVLIPYEEAGFTLNLLLLVTFFTFYLRKFISKRLIYTSIFIIFIALLLVQSVKKSSVKYEIIGQAVNKNYKWNKWNPEMMKSNNGKPRFINFTAKWCLTCKVNKKLVLQTDDFSSFAREKQLELVEADWTHRDPAITNFLQGHKIFGVPAYFIQKANGEVISLGETISLDKIKKHL